MVITLIFRSKKVFGILWKGIKHITINKKFMETNLVIRKALLKGKVKVSGAQNSALRLLAASLLTNETIELNNCPYGLVDVQVQLEMIRVLGKYFSTVEETDIINEEESVITSLDWRERYIQNALLIFGALVTRFGEGRVPLPGGGK